LKTTCDWINTEITIYMELEDWYGVSMYFNSESDDGSMYEDSIIKTCFWHRTEDWVGCTFILGVVDADYYGVTKSLQQQAGFVSNEILEWTAKWVRI